MIYGSEHLATTRIHMHKMAVANMQMLRLMCVKIRNDRIMNEKINNYLGLVLLKDKIQME